MDITFYRCTLAIIVEVDGVKYRSFLFTENFLSAENARDYGELLIKQKLAIGYRVTFALPRSNSWMFHEYVKFISDEQSKLQVLDFNKLTA